MEQKSREIELLKSMHAKELEALRSSVGSVQAAVERALQEERARLAGQAAAAKYSQDQRSLWLRSPDCVLQVLCLVAFNGHPAWNFASLSRAFRGDEALWGCIKDRRGPFGKTYLTACSLSGNLARVRWLLDMGANVNLSSADFDRTSLMAACQSGHLEVVRELLRRGASVNATESDGWTSFMWACAYGHLEIVRELMGHGANVNATLTDGMTSLMIVCENGCLEIVRELLERGVNVNANAQTEGGWTPLMHACSEGYLEVARLLLAHHASKTAVDSNGKTAYKHTPAEHAELRKLVKP